MTDVKKVYAVEIRLGESMIRPEPGQVFETRTTVYEVARETPKTLMGYDGARNWERRFRKEKLDLIKPSLLEENQIFSFFTDEESKVETLVLKGLGLAAIRSREQLKKAERELADLEKAIDSILKKSGDESS